MLIGYLCPCPGNRTHRATQRRALAEAGCEQVVEEQPDAEDGGEQSELDRLLARLRAGDVAVVPRLDSLGRLLPDVVRRVQRLTAAGAGLRSLAETLDAAVQNGATTATEDSLLPAGDGQDAPQLTGAGRPAAPGTRRRAGKRPPRLPPGQRAKMVDEALSGRFTPAELAWHCGVSEAMISRLLAARRAAALASPEVGQAEESAAFADLIADVLPFSALHERLAIVGTSGSGKTYAAKGLLERVMAGGGRVRVVDPLVVRWGLGKGADGGAPPFPVAVFGGAHADVPLILGMAAALGRLVGTQPIACVVDVSDLGSAAARRRFMATFTEALHAANTEPLHLVLDEADLWVPQRTQQNGRDLLNHVEEIVRRGRVRGFVPWLITQRPATLHKDVLSQADLLVSMKLTSSQDREAVGRWIEGQADRSKGRRILDALPRLGRGEGWVWAPRHGVLARVTFPRIRTLDSSQTPHREAQASVPSTLGPVNLTAVRKALAAAVGNMEGVQQRRSLSSSPGSPQRLPIFLGRQPREVGGRQVPGAAVADPILGFTLGGDLLYILPPTAGVLWSGCRLLQTHCGETFTC